MIRFQRPSLPSSDSIERYLSLAREERWFSNFGPCCRLLRNRLEEMVGGDVVPVANATIGLIAAVAAVRGRAPAGASEALVPSFAFAASAQSAVWNGLEPVFVDVDAEHWHMDSERLEDALVTRKGRIGVVIALSSFGTPPPPSVRHRWEDACRAAGVPLVVDSAAGFGARAADGTPVGLQGDVEVVSFHAVKPLAIGEGGAVFSRDAEIAAEVQRLIQFGFDERRRVTVRHGINGKLSEPAAAIALAALDEFDGRLEMRKAAAQEIVRRLPPDFAVQRDHDLGTWQFVPVKAASAEHREAALENSRDVVELRTYYEPLDLMPAFRSSDRTSDLSVTADLGRRMLSVPMADDLDDDEIAVIVGTLEGAAVLQADRTR
jgi:dTDP-4-amino-4,6-dideoxygalactose transaminase